jgi:hypothetical protein
MMEEKRTVKLRKKIEKLNRSETENTVACSNSG